MGGEIFPGRIPFGEGKGGVFHLPEKKEKIKILTVSRTGTRKSLHLGSMLVYKSIIKMLIPVRIEALSSLYAYNGVIESGFGTATSNACGHRSLITTLAPLNTSNSLRTF